MKLHVGLGIIVLLVLLTVSPVAAWHAILVKSGPAGEQCTSSDSVSYTIQAQSGLWNENKIEITDILPQDLIFDSLTSSWSQYTVDTSQADRVIITLFNVPKNTNIDIHLVLKPTASHGPGEVVNTVSSRVEACFRMDNGVCMSPSGYWEGTRSSSYHPDGGIWSVSTTFSDTVCASIPTPEFPTVALPAGLIIGLMGAVLFIRCTKEY